MHDALASLALAAVATATPSPAPEVDPNLVTPGPWGFVVIVFVALAVFFLVWDMMRRIRRGRVRADLNEELDAELQAAAAAEATEVDDQRADAGETDDNGDDSAGTRR